ncbi:MAG: cupredoxin domain-containing protein [Nitrospirae bacterium]|nr:cupredoxin domain-containing protein [Nitrospirota bacterium]
MTTCALCATIVLTGASWAAGDDERRLTIKDHAFSPQEITVKANTKIKLVVTNEDPAAEEFDSPSLNREKLIRPGQSATILLPPLKPGRYEFFGEFHPETARGAVIAE